MNVAPDRWQRIQDLCEALEAYPVTDHARRLERLEADGTLRAEVLDLLAAVREEERTQQGIGLEIPPPDASVPSSIAGYRVAERIGMGGSGEVFRATRVVNGVQQAVALKRFHAHRSSAEHLERFAREQQVLAAMHHPDIVHFLDAGVTDDGRPFLVMDLADGEPITDYSDARRLKLTDRIALVRAVCDAVQAAHRQLVVHLDLKPSNILVSDAGRVKLLDFGTAKLIDASADGTRTQSLTVRYASPEQLRGETVSAACDIYSLGLILHEVAGGGWPFPRPESIVSTAERAAGRLDPAPLERSVTASAATDRRTSEARLRQQLRGDLDAICRKAMAHEPQARYGSASELADDLGRFLRGEPVRAQPSSGLYHVMKFARRHRWAVLAAGVIFVALTGAAVYSIRQANLARLESQRTEATNALLTSVLTLTSSDATSRTDMTARELLTLAEKRLSSSLGDDPIVAANFEIALAQAFVAREAFPEARTLYERARARASAAGDVSRQALAGVGLAYLMYVRGETADSWAEATAALDLWQRNRSAFRPAQAALVLSEGAKTLTYLRPADLTPRPYFVACLDIAAASYKEVSPAVRALCLVGLATSYTMADSRYDKAQPLLDEAVAIQRADPTAAAVLSTTLQMRGMVGRYQGRFEDDERAQLEAYEIAARLQGAGSMSALWQRAVWASSLTGVGREEEAYRESVAILKSARLLVKAPNTYMLWTPLISAAAGACHTSRFGECEKLALEALSTLGPSPAPDDSRPPAARGYLGIAMAADNRCAEARPLLEAAIASNRAHARVAANAPLLERALARCAQ